MFGNSEPLRNEKIHENVLPTTVLAGIILAGVAAPFLPKAVGPLAIAQARKPQPLEDTISEAPPIQAQKLGRSHTVAGSNTKSRRRRAPHGAGDQQNHNSRTSTSVAASDDKARPPLKARQSSTRQLTRQATAIRHTSLGGISFGEGRSVSPSLVDLHHARGIRKVDGPPSPLSQKRPSLGDLRRHSYDPKSVATLGLTQIEKTHMLRSHYFKTETLFLTALEGISNRLVALPKPARLSALRAELALIARDLPAEVDIPLLCPATLEDGLPSHSKHHRIVRLNPAEATSLNSAERVPYLLMVEVLREDFDFNPESASNQRLLSSLILDIVPGKRRPFDITSAGSRSSDDASDSDHFADGLDEPASGDLSSPDLLKDLENNTAVSGTNIYHAGIYASKSRSSTPRAGSGAFTPFLTMSTPYGSDSPISRTSNPGLKKLSGSSKDRSLPLDQPDISALATHMRTAAQMLAQLDVSGSKRPKQEVESIRSKIIASMQNLEEQNFASNEPSPPTFESIMATASPTTIRDDSTELTDSPENLLETGVLGGAAAGAERMENDQKTGGVRRKGDRDDPSAAMFGEDWKSKRDRIQRTSSYGWMKNWDLLSVIVKTGSDLRQELFACQLIRICSKVWEDAGVPVWVKQMRILVTGESSGLIETITNGVSVHSLKRSLTLSSIATGNNPRKRFSTLADHFTKTFGEPDSETYKAGRDAFMRSLAAYSMLSYILQLKDRHNGNILIDNQGHIIHIDFGFMLSNSPGSVGFEAAPFKLTQDYVDVLGGPTSACFDGFKTLCKQAFQALRKSAENIVMVVELMSKESKMACFQSGGLSTVGSLRSRFMLHLSREEAESFVENDLVAKSLGSYYTRLYDTFQYRTQGIY